MAAQILDDTQANAKTGLTDAEAFQIFDTINQADGNAPGALNGNGLRNPLPGLNEQQTNAVVRQGQTANTQVAEAINAADKASKAQAKAQQDAANQVLIDKVKAAGN